MAHQLREDDQMFYLLRDDVPWHGLGKALEVPPATSEEAIRMAGLDWEVEKRGLYYEHADAASKDAKEGWAHSRASSSMSVVRKDTGRELGVIKAGFQPFQNRDAFKFFDQAIGNGVEYRVAGSLKNNQIIWILVSFPLFLQVGGPEDKLYPFIVLANSHSGEWAWRLQYTMVRVICNNTFVASMREGDIGAAPMTKIGHKKGIEERVLDVAKSLEQARLTFERSQELFNQLAQTKVTEDQAMEYFHRLEPNPAPDKNPARREASRAIMWDAFNIGPGAELASAQGTAWGLFNAATYYIDHVRGTRSVKVTDAHRDHRLTSGWFGDGRAYKQRALSYAVELMEVG